MELRQLLHFVAACQQQNHARAAEHLKISRSALSQSLGALEKELSLRLFEYGSAGLRPTMQGRIMFQPLQTALRQMLLAGARLRAGGTGGVDVIKVRSPMRLALGQFSTATLWTAQLLEERNANIFFDIRFRDPPIPFLHQEMPDVADEQPDLVLDYRVFASDASEEIYADPWTAVANFDHQPAPGDIEQQLAGIRRSKRILLPALPLELIEAAHRLCRYYDFPDPEETDLDAGSLADRSVSQKESVVIVPESIVPDWVRPHVRLVPLDRVPPNMVTAHHLTARPETRALVDELRKALSRPGPMRLPEPDVTWRQLGYVLELSKHSTLTSLARALNVTQPAVSNQMRKLEALARHPLFERSAAGIRVPPSTHQVAELVQTAAETLTAAIGLARSLASTQKGRIVIGVVPFADGTGTVAQALAKLLLDWREARPEIDVRLLVAPTSTLELWLKMQRLDFALVENASQSVRKLLLQVRDTMGVVTATGAPLPAADAITLREAAELRLILPTQIFGSRRIIDDAARAAGVKIRPAMEIDSLPITLELVRRSDLATIMPFESVRRGVNQGELHFAALSDPLLERQMSIIYSADYPLPDHARDFIADLRKLLAAV